MALCCGKAFLEDAATRRPLKLVCTMVLFLTCAPLCDSRDIGEDGQTQSSVTRGPCGPSCVSQCLAGMCLYAQSDLDAEDPFVSGSSSSSSSNSFVDANVAAAQPSASEAGPVEPLLSSRGLNEDVGAAKTITSEVAAPGVVEAQGIQLPKQNTEAASAAMLAVQESIRKLEQAASGSSSRQVASARGLGVWPPPGNEGFRVAKPVQASMLDLGRGPSAWRGTVSSLMSLQGHNTPDKAASLTAETVSAGEGRTQQFSATATDASHEASFLSNEISHLQSVLSQAKADEVELKAKNLALSRELSSWRSAGVRVMQRDAEALNILSTEQGGQLKSIQPVAAREGTAALQVAEVVGQHQGVNGHSGKQALGQSFLQHSRSHTDSFDARTWQLLMAGGVVVSIVVTFLAWSCVSKKGSAAIPRGRIMRASETQVAQEVSRWRLATEPMLQRVGLVPYQVEISEIHFGSLGAYGDVHAELRLGDDEALRTEVVQASDGSFVRFSECFTFRVHRGREILRLAAVTLPCGEEVASLELTATELVNLACREKRSYHRAPMKASGQEMEGMRSSDDSRSPYAAMRIRSIARPVCKG
mmetsp:Transcript_74321/g.177079  ORF Transcript_74321/g.177079 Transcript_74321/m.177079 type:complete len:588 (-) Transcript_74321:136-1899(-)